MEFAFGLLLTQAMQHLWDLVLLPSWEPSLEALEGNIFLWIFFEILAMNRLVHSHGVQMEDIQTNFSTLLILVPFITWILDIRLIIIIIIACARTMVIFSLMHMATSNQTFYKSCIRLVVVLRYFIFEQRPLISDVEPSFIFWHCFYAAEVGFPHYFPWGFVK